MPGDCAVFGAALPDSFVRNELANWLERRGFLSCTGWKTVRAALRDLPARAGEAHVARDLLPPLAAALGYAPPRPAPPVRTREGLEGGGFLLQSESASLRVWCIGNDDDFEASRRTASNHRTSPMRCAQRVLLARRELRGLILSAREARLLISDPTRADGAIGFDFANPSLFPLLHALARVEAAGVIPDLLDAGRLNQARVTAALRSQARDAVSLFLDAVVRHPDNAGRLPEAEVLWAQGLVLIYRLLFVLKLEGGTLGGRFTESALWRQALSPSSVLAPLVRQVLDHAAASGRLLEDGLRTVFAVCRDGLDAGETQIPPLAGALFSSNAMTALEALSWGERGVAMLLDRLLWTASSSGLERVRYAALGVEELGHVYEGLLDQQPRLAAGRFLLRGGPGRKTSGSFYTPRPFVRFLVQRTLAPILAARCPADDPNPAAILDIRVLDPAAGSGHFLVEACRFLADGLYAACLSCDADPSRRDRLDVLPSAEILAAYLPSRVPEGNGRGISEEQARALCRRMVAVNCIYGADRNPLAIELAKLSLWLESHAEGLPLTFLDHRLVAGDSLSGPMLRDLATLPVTRSALDPLLAGAVLSELERVRAAAGRDVAALNATVGRDLGEQQRKDAAKARLDHMLAPWRNLARAWAGAVMLALPQADDEWLALARHVAETTTWPTHLTRAQTQLLTAGATSLSWDAVFPDIFASDRGGFDAVLCNPPWEVVQANGVEFAAGVEKEDDATDRLRAYRDSFIRQHRAVSRLYRCQTGGSPSRLDTFRVFAERTLHLSGHASAIGMVVPSAFHANEGAAATRRLFFDLARIETCLSFENRRRFFDIHASFRFALLVARRPGPTDTITCGFYLSDLADADTSGRTVRYDRAFIEATGGPGLGFLELRSAKDMPLARQMFLGRETLGAWCQARGKRLGREMNVTDDAHRVMPAASLRGAGLVFQEGKTIHQFTDQWSVPRYAVPLKMLKDRPAWLEVSRHFRLSLRKIARSTDERTTIAAILPPGSICNDTAPVERTPALRPNATALVLCAILNSFTFDWALRQKIAATVNLFLLEACPICPLPAETERMLAQGALRLCCNHSGFAPLWREQTGAAWNGTWPVLSNPVERWRLRAEMDAVVAHAYGLTRRQYTRILDSFTHRTCPDMPDWCLAAFDADPD